MSIIGNPIVTGGGGVTASIFVTGLSNTDTVTATKGTKTLTGKWTQKPNPDYIGLPDGYTQLEYIKSTGTQYINTEFVHSAENASLEIDFSPLVVGDYRFCGAYKTNPGLRTFILDPYNSTLRIGLGSQDIDVQSIGAGTRYNVSLSVENGSYQCIVNSSTATSTYSGSIITGLSFYLFAVNLDNAASYYASMKLYSCKLYQSDVLVRDLVPAKRNSDGVLGLYDLVNDVFYTNAGTGTFVAGAEIPQTFDGFLIKPIRELGTWTVTATDGVQTATQDVLVDVITEYEIEMSLAT